MMMKYYGESIYKGIGIGKILFYSNVDYEITKEEDDNVFDVSSEVERFESAKASLLEELDDTYKRAQGQVGTDMAKIFEGHKAILDDPSFTQAIISMIVDDGIKAEYATMEVCNSYCKIFDSMEDENLRAKSMDIRDISMGLIRTLKVSGSHKLTTDEPVILVTSNILPSQVIEIDKSKVLGLVTRAGTARSHASILTKSMRIPSLQGVEISSDWNGRLAILDGFKGLIILDPDQATIDKYTNKLKLKIDKEKEEDLKFLKDFFKRRRDMGGKGMEVFANLNNPSEIDDIIETGVDGIGLFRTEFIYMNRTSIPTEEEQFRIYKMLAESMASKRVVIRTLDIGGDKKPSYLNFDKEDNPALGYRGIRVSLDRIDLFKAQLRAIYRASAYGNLAVLYPMITSLEEVCMIKDIVEEVKEELRYNKVSYRDIDQGIMIETPAAAIISDYLAKEVDFFSIGTNDLTQYTLAIDRENVNLAPLCNSHHEAVLRLIRLVVENSHDEGIRVGICGELAADTELIKDFIEMGLDEISVSVDNLLSVARKISEIESRQ